MVSRLQAPPTERPAPLSGREKEVGGGRKPPGARSTAPQRSPVSETLRATGVTSPPLDGDITPAGLTVLTFKAGGEVVSRLSQM